MELAKAIKPTENPWIVQFDQKENAKINLICFHYAGGSASFFAKWNEFVGPNIQLIAVQLPGRRARLHEKPLRRISEIVSAFDQAVKPFLNKPFAVIGYSLGSVLAFEWIRLLQDRQGLAPIFFFPMACSAPQISLGYPKIHQMVDKEFLEMMGQLFGAIPNSVLSDPDMIAAMLPGMKADIEVLETYRFQENRKLNVPILAIGGDMDPATTSAGLAAWQEHTEVRFEMREYQGDHFFVNGHEKEIVSFITSFLSNPLSSSSARET